MTHALANAIRQQTDDLKDELKELDRWQDEVARQQEANKKRKVRVASEIVPPIRGTVPSLKEAVLKAGGSSTEDPLREAKDKGNDLFQSGKWAEAIEAYSSGINLDPEGSTSHVLYGNRALCYLKMEKYREAERDATSCVRLNRSYAKGYYRRALARKQLRDLKGARTDLEAVLALVPNDANATYEMDLVTQMLKVERDKVMKPSIKKKIVIAEVDDDDDDGDEEKKDNNGNCSHGNLNGDEMQKEIFNEIEELERIREAQRNLRQTKAVEAEAELGRRRRTNPRVEVLEDPKDESVTEEVPQQSVKKSEQPPAVNSKNLMDTSSFKATVQKETILPRPFKSTSKWSKETLKTPKSFTEFERVFSEIAKNEELCMSYVSLIPPGNLRTLFGNNMTPEILLGFLRTVRKMPCSVAIAFLRGLCSVKRVEDICLFFDNSERKVAHDVIEMIISSGASPNDVEIFKQKLKV